MPEASVAQQRAALIQIDAPGAAPAVADSRCGCGGCKRHRPARRAEDEFIRASALVDEGGVSRSVYETATAERIRARAAVEQATAQAQYARNQLDVIGAQRESVTAALYGAEAKLFRATNDLDATTIRAPREGLIAGRNVRVGEYVTASARLMAVAPTKDLWVEAYLRETQLSGFVPAIAYASKSTRFGGGLTAEPWKVFPAPADRNSHCCRRTMPPATSPRSFGASRFGFCSIQRSRRSIGWRAGCPCSP